MADPTYIETASAAGAWDAVMKPVDLASREDVHEALIAACTPGIPVTAAIQETLGAVDRIVFLRDPSRTHGTPSVEDCGNLVDSLRESEGWQTCPAIGLEPALLVMLGLREGYDRGARIHDTRVVYEQLNACSAVSYRVDPVHLVSARWVEGKIRAYDEPGALLTIEAINLPAVTRIAGMFRQDRIVVTDYPASRTYALRSTEGASRA